MKKPAKVRKPAASNPETLAERLIQAERHVLAAKKSLHSAKVQLKQERKALKKAKKAVKHLRKLCKRAASKKPAAPNTKTALRKKTIARSA